MASLLTPDLSYKFSTFNTLYRGISYERITLPCRRARKKIRDNLTSIRFYTCYLETDEKGGDKGKRRKGRR